MVMLDGVNFSPVSRITRPEIELMMKKIIPAHICISFFVNSFRFASVKCSNKSLSPRQSARLPAKIFQGIVQEQLFIVILFLALLSVFLEACTYLPFFVAASLITRRTIGSFSPPWPVHQPSIAVFCEVSLGLKSLW